MAPHLLGGPSGPPRGQPQCSGTSRRIQQRDADAPSPLASSSEIRARIRRPGSQSGRWTSTGVGRGYFGHPQTTSHKPIAAALSGCCRPRTRPRAALGTRVEVADLGRMTVNVGPSSDPGTSIRRRVLACWPSPTRPDFSSTRDQVLDSLWPELEPALALNSLNQTMYFMRRVFEEDFNEDLSPGYVHHDSEVIWLDPELVSSSSSECASTIDPAYGAGSDPGSRLRACRQLYRGRFALDFEYEEWAAGVPRLAARVLPRDRRASRRG